MKLDTACKIKRDFVSRLTQAYRVSAALSEANTEHYKRITDIMKQIPEKTPQWVRHYLSGYREAMYNVMSSKQRFMYEFNGKLYGIDSHLPDYYTKHGITPEELCKFHGKSGFYWADTLKPFFVEDRRP